MRPDNKEIAAYLRMVANQLEQDAPPLVVISVENTQDNDNSADYGRTRTTRNVGQTITITVATTGNPIADDLAEFDKNRAEVLERIKRGGRRTSGRIV